MKCFRLRCCVNNSFLVFHQGTKHSKTIKHSRFALVFHTVFSCLDPLMKHSNSLFTYNMKANNVEEPSIVFNRCHEKGRTFIREVQMRWKGEKPRDGAAKHAKIHQAARYGIFKLTQAYSRTLTRREIRRAYAN